MIKVALLGTTTLRSVAALALVAGAAPAFAQDVQDPGAVPSTEGTLVDQTSPNSTDAATSAADSEIVITGSRIRRAPEFTGIEPVTVIGKDEITQSGFISATDALQSNAVTQGSSQINNEYGGFVTDGGTGANTLGLRGLGPARTLILLNGRRLAPGGTRGSVLATDLNVLPTAIVNRIEVLKAGASSVYGSDAVAGVVNIITDTKLTGLNLEAQVSVPEVGAGVDHRVSASFGVDANRLNLVGSVEYRKRDGIARNDVPRYRCPIGGFLSGEGTPLGSGDNFDPNDPRACFTLDNGGVTINTLGIPTRQGIGRTSGAVGNFNRFVPAPGVTTGPFPGFLGVGTYDRDTFDPRQEEEELVTPVETYTGYLAATYQVEGLGNAEIYGEILANRRKSSSKLYRQLSLDYLRGSPLLPESIRDGAFLAPTVTSSGQIIAARAFIGFGLTDSEQTVDFVRASGGIRGDLPFSGWRYDAYVGKSWNDGEYINDSFLTDRLANSLNVVANGDGTFRCATLADANCVPAPALTAAVIGGQLPQDFRDYIVDPVRGTTQFRETTFALNFDGPLFKLPGGDVQLAVGAEYRKQSINDQPPADSINGNLFGLTAATTTVGTDNVKEVYGELFVPLLQDVPFFYRLNFTGSARYTDYASYGSDTTYKVAGEWEIFRGLGVRASYGTSYRAPALAEQFLGATSGFLSASTDPCDDLPAPAAQSPEQQITARNCAAVGLPVGFAQTNSVTVYQVGGAEAGLSAETSTNLNLGVVVTPPIPASLGSLSLSLDYFDIQVDNGVSQITAGNILNRCYNADNFDPTAGFCRFVTRDSNNALTVITSYVNLSEDIVKGFEFNGRYAKSIFGGDFVLNANVTHYTEQSTRQFADEYLTDANGILTVPDWVGNFDANYTIGNVTLRYGLDWVDSSGDETYDYFAFDNVTGTTDPDTVQFYKDNYNFNSDDYFRHNASVQFNLEKKYQLTLGVRNFTNSRPPRITAGGFSVNGNYPIYSGYDPIGRTFFASTNFKF